MWLMRGMVIVAVVWLSSVCVAAYNFKIANARLSMSRTNEIKGDESKKRRIRAEDAVISLSLAVDINQARALFLLGRVLMENGEIVKSPAVLLKVEDAAKLRLKHSKQDIEPFVSRAGRKLQHAIDHFTCFKSSVTNAVCIDIGASTGGFSDVLLRNNCSRIYAVDVGQSLLDWKIRSDPRVIPVEKVNARFLNSSHVGEDSGFISVIVCDVSFISLKRVLPPAMTLCQPSAVVCTLIKPQFECRREDIGTGGIVRDPALRLKVVEEITSWFASSFPDWKHLGTIESPITGQDGNVEYLFVAVRGLESI